MPTQKNFKKLVRGRMAKTGESYTAAWAQLSPTVEQDPTSVVLARALAAAGVVNPLTSLPFGPELLFGLGGGVGFAYLVFSYPGLTTVHVDGRFNALYFAKTGFIETACARLGVPLRVWPTTDAAMTEKRLRQALATTAEVALTVDLVRLPGHDVPPHAPYAPRTVTVSQAPAGLLVRGLRSGQTTMDLSALLDARWTGNKKYGGLFLCGQPASPPDVPAALAAAVARTAECLLSPGRGNAGGADQRSQFDGSFGVPGLRRWARLLTDGRDKKGWPTLFGDREPLDGALAAVVRGLGGPDTGGTACRRPYAAFLDDALPSDAAVRPGDAYRRLGDGWAAVVELARRPGVTAAELAEPLPDLADAEESAARSLAAVGGAR